MSTAADQWPTAMLFPEMPQARCILRQMLCATHVKSEFARKISRNCDKNLLILTIPHRRNIYGIVNKYRLMGSLLSQKTKPKSQVLTEEKLHETDTSIEHSIRKSIAHK
jgi:hypothetical protein